ncbi:hypothetical protein GCM10009605_40130 [Nocardiopsis composta]
MEHRAAHTRGAGDAGDGDQEEKKKINLSAPQVIAGGIATLTAATAASFLGVYGTILGAAVMSVMSTAGTAVTQHFLERSRDKAKEVVGAGLTVVHRGGPSDPSDPDAAAGPGRYRDPEATAVFGSVGTAGAADATRAMPSLGDPHRDGAGPERDEEPRTWWQRYRMLVIPAAVVFAGVMLVILVFELFTGRSLSDTVHGRDGHSSPSLMGGSSQSQEVDDEAPDTGATPGTGEDGGTAPQDGATTDPGTGGQGQPVDPETGTDPGTGGQQTLDPGTGDTGGTGDGGTGGTGGEQGQDGTGGTGEQEQDGTGGQGQQAPQGGTGGGSNGGAAPQSQDLGTG